MIGINTTKSNKRQRLYDCTMLPARRKILAALSYAVAYRARSQNYVLWLRSDCTHSRFYLHSSTEKREAHCRSLHIVRSSNLPVSRNEQRDPTPICICTLPQSQPIRGCSNERYVYNIPMASSLQGFLADHEVFEVSQCQKTKRQ